MEQRVFLLSANAELLLGHRSFPLTFPEWAQFLRFGRSIQVLIRLLVSMDDRTSLTSLKANKRKFIN